MENGWLTGHENESCFSLCLGCRSMRNYHGMNDGSLLKYFHTERKLPTNKWVASWRHFTDVRQIRDRIKLASAYSNWSVFHIHIYIYVYEAWHYVTLSHVQWPCLVLASSSFIVIDRSPPGTEARPRASPGCGTVRRLSWRTWEDAIQLSTQLVKGPFIFKDS